jgi:hypothetical protein
MRTLIGLGLASWLLAAACGNGSAFPDNTVGNYCEQVGNAACDKARSCNAPATSMCEENVLAACCRSTDCDRMLPGVAESLVATCISALQAETCGTLLAGQTPPECRSPAAASTTGP